jgi:phosphoglycerol transferase MdoB-like AlkP superfamily enzyme
MMIYTFPMILNHSASYYNRVVFTISPAFDLPLSNISRNAYFFVEGIGIVLQLMLIVFLLLKNTRKKYDIPF